MSNFNTAREFSTERVWEAIRALLVNDLGNEVDVDCIGDRDYDEQGALVVIPPVVRIIFLEETPGEPLGMDALNYATTQRFAVLCADEDLGPNPQKQRDATIRLVSQVKRVLTGARLDLGDGCVSEPVRWVGTVPLPTNSVGFAYVPSFDVGGVAYFPGQHAQPTVPPEGLNG